MSRYALQMEEDPRVVCRSCGQPRSLEQYRLFKTQPTMYMDFCVECEKRDGTIALYRRYHAYATKEIVTAVYAAERVPAERRTQEMVRLLLAPTTARVVETKEQAVEVELERRELCRRRLIYFTTTFQPDYKPGWVHQDICRRLERFVEQVERSESPRLMIALPPRAGKSALASDIFPSWVLGKHPEWGIIGASHSITLPTDFSRNIRDRVRDAEYSAIFTDTRLRTDSQGVEAWKTTKGGGYIAAGVGTGINGKGMHIGIADDLIKDAEAAGSEVIRQSALAWYLSVFYTRLAPGGGILLIGCLTGDTLVSMGDNTRKRLDAVCVGDTVKSWKDGELVTRRVVNWAPQAVDDIFEIRTGNGTVRANGRHPFLVRSAKGHYKWVRTRDLASLGANNCLVHAGAEPAGSGEDRVTAEQARLLGFMFGDGWLTRRDSKNYDKARNVYYPRRGFVTCVARGVHEDTNSWVLQAFDSEFGVAPKLTKHGYWRTETQSVGRWFAEHGLCGGAHTKRLPEWLFTQSVAVRRAFLDGFVDADGYVGVRNRVTITLCNELLVRDLRALAQSVGLKPSNVHLATRRAKAPNSPVEIVAESANVQWQHQEYDDAPFYFRRIRSIKPAGRELVYDMEIEETHNYIADGLVTHNTRWHDADVQGALLEKEAMLRKAGVPDYELDNWEVVSYPAIAEHDEFLLSTGEIWRDAPPANEPFPRLLRAKGEALHPERYPLEALLRIKNVQPKSTWSALYQQNPTPDDGEFFKKGDLRYQHIAKDYWLLAKRFIVTDYAIKKNQRNDYTTIAALALTGNDDLYVLEIVHARMDTYEIAAAIVRLVEMYQPHIYAGEQGQIHAAVWPVVEKELKARRLYVSVDNTLVPIVDKEARARPLQARTQMHKFFFSYQGERPDVYNDAEREMLRFPNGRHDDIVDALAWGARLALNVSLPSSPQPKRKEGWQAKLRAHAAASNSYMAA